MTKYLLDTNVLIDMGRGVTGIRDRILNVGPENCFVSAISIAELQTGCDFTGNEQERQLLVFCKSRFQTIPVTEGILKTFSEMKAAQLKIGVKVPDFDMIIAATAKFHKFTVVTHDIRHFQSIEGVKREDWLPDLE